MRVIAARMLDNGMFPQVGTLDQTIFNGKTLRPIVKKAIKWADGRQVRLEIYLNENNFYGNPDRIEFYRAIPRN